MRFLPLSCVVVVVTMGVLMSAPVFALSRQGLIRQAYMDILGRVPTPEELAEADTKAFDNAALQTRLNALPERDRAITQVYRDALLRRPRPNEVVAWKSIVAPLNRVRKGVYSTDEWRGVVVDIYLSLLGRTPRDNEIVFYALRRVRRERIRQALMASGGRRTAIEQQFRSVLGRMPEESERAYFITSGQDLEFIGRNSAPTAHAGDDQVVPNDTLSVQLDGSKSADLEGDAFTYQWSVVEAPLDTTAALSDIHSAQPVVVVPTSTDDPLYRVPGVYRFRLVVSDGQSRSVPDEVEIRVLPWTSFESQLIESVNTLRTIEGATTTPALVPQETLMRLARRYSRYLFVNGWFESTDRDGKTPADRVRAETYPFGRVGENIALIKSRVPMKLTKKRTKDIYDGWYASTEHKKNMVKLDFLETGVGFYAGQFGLNDYRIYATQLFVAPPTKKDEAVVVPAPKPSPVPTPTVTPTQTPNPSPSPSVSLSPTPTPTPSGGGE